MESGEGWPAPKNDDLRHAVAFRREHFRIGPGPPYPPDRSNRLFRSTAKTTMQGLTLALLRDFTKLIRNPGYTGLHDPKSEDSAASGVAYVYFPNLPAHQSSFPKMSGIEAPPPSP